jgi:hypothetical protein
MANRPSTRATRTRHTDGCVFCGCKELSRTHIWPSWLNELLSPPAVREVKTEVPIPTSPSSTRVETDVMAGPGSIFSMKPYLCCIACNTGWMQKFEDEMLKFSPPIFASTDEVVLTGRQVRVISVWVTLIAILGEYIDTTRDSVTVSQEDREFVKKRLLPPDSWTITGCSLNAGAWRHKYRHHTLFIGEFGSILEYHTAVMSGVRKNTQISSFGMGNLFIQVFHCPDFRQVQNFQSAAKAAGLVRMWPPPFRMWPWKQRSLKFPTKLVINDDQADTLADAFNERVKVMTQPPFFGGQFRGG